MYENWNEYAQAGTATYIIVHKRTAGASGNVCVSVSER